MHENWLFRNVILENSASPVDIAIRHGRVAEIGPGLAAGGSRVVNASGMLASPLFIDPHHHLDCAFLSDPPNLSGTLEEAIRINARLKISRSDEDIFKKACRAGADVVSGMPHTEPSPEAAARHIEIAFQIAAEFDADIDMHVDETDNPGSRTLELLADATLRHAYQGRVTAGHCCALAAYPDDYARHVIEKVSQAHINVITNPLVNLYLQGRHDRQPVRRGLTRVKQLLEAGATVACGSRGVAPPPSL